MAYIETRETHKKDALRTHWYQGTYAEMKKALEQMAKDFGYEIVDCNDHYQEMLLEGMNSTISIKVSSFGRYEQGVDFNLDNKFLLDLGRGVRLITKMYEYLGACCKFKGVSLHP